MTSGRLARQRITPHAAPLKGRNGYRRRRIHRPTAILLPKKVAIDLAVTRIICTFVRRNCNNETRSKKVQHPHPVACPSQDGAADSRMLQDAARLKVRLFGSYAPFYCQINKPGFLKKEKDLLSPSLYRISFLRSIFE